MRDEDVLILLGLGALVLFGLSKKREKTFEELVKRKAPYEEFVKHAREVEKFLREHREEIGGGAGGFVGVRVVETDVGAVYW